jgi:hypothetical protein
MVAARRGYLAEMGEFLPGSAKADLNSFDLPVRPSRSASGRDPAGFDLGDAVPLCGRRPQQDAGAPV